MADKEFEISLDIENIGPHSDKKKITFSDDVDSNKAIFFATNGTGKSFISRAFRLSSSSMIDSLADDVLTIGQNRGCLHFRIKSNSASKDLRIMIQRGVVPSIQNNTGLLFHVFNSDYVEENIKQKNYTPDGQIGGYILGKVQIDLSEERKKEGKLDAEAKALSKKIDDTITEAISKLRAYGITPNTTEIRQITRYSVENGFDFECSDSFESIVKQLSTLERVPESLQSITFSVPIFRLDFLQEIRDILEEEYPKSEWDEDFVREYKDHQSFIEAGLDAEHSDEICPFCKRVYDINAHNLIIQYKDYRTDKESQVISCLKKLLSKVEDVIRVIQRQNNQNNTAIIQLVEIQKYFPSLVDSSIDNLSAIDDYISPWNAIKDLINVKIGNLSAVPSNTDELLSACRLACTSVVKLQESNERVIRHSNRVKEDSRSERLALRRNLCKAEAQRLHLDMMPLFADFKKKNIELQVLRKDIEIKEQKARVSKRDKVYETFETMLDNFFAGKYQIEKETFQIKFQGSKIGNNASKVLSDGEKSIVAFCWYLAETHILVNKETEYDKLFFIIDDPISSMDFHFVYAVAQSLRSMKTLFDMNRHERVWVFTHNIEFFSIVARNHVLTTTYMLKPGKIVRFNHQLLLPYENHLRDLIDIAEGEKGANHTTGNSIRHVIETISRFEDPEVGIATYVNNSSALMKDPCIFSLCQDLSHGTVRLEIPYNEDVLKGACKTVVDFIEGKYPKQVERIRCHHV